MKIKYFNHYFNSFRLGRKFFYVLGIDAAFWTTIGLIFIFFAGILNRQAEALSGGKSASQLQQFILNSSTDQLQTLAAQLKVFMLSMIGGAVIYALLFLALYSLSRFLIWNLILNKKINFKKYLKWNLLNVVVFIILVITVLIYYIILFPVLFLGVAVLEQILMILFFIAFLFLVFLIYRRFTQSYKIWPSIGKAFEDIKSHFKAMAVAYSLAILTLIALGLVLFLLMKFIVPYEFSLYLIILGLLAYLAWLRLYVAEVLE